MKQGYFFGLSVDFVARLAERFPELGLETDVAPPADRLSVDALKGVAETPPFNLRLDDGIYAALVAALESGKNVVLTGPPGTAKTTLAEAVSATAESLGLCRGYLLTTATADWTTYETIGGLRPVKGGELEFAPGHFLDAIQKHKWLVIDELNRSQFDRAFGQLFTVLSGQAVTLPYALPGADQPLTLFPRGVDPPASENGNLGIPNEWRIIATMNVFDKNLLFEMSYALMRRFAFIEVPSPDELVFRELILEAADGDELAAETASALLPVRAVKDIGPAAYQDVARFCAERRLIGSIDEDQLRFQAFYSYLLPQFEGVTDEEADELLKSLVEICGDKQAITLQETLHDVLGVEVEAAARRPGSGDTDEEDRA